MFLCLALFASPTKYRALLQKSLDCIKESYVRRFRRQEAQEAGAAAKSAAPNY
jgi:hypothetical protein